MYICYSSCYTMVKYVKRLVSTSKPACIICHLHICVSSSLIFMLF